MLSNECQCNNQLLYLLDLCVFYSSSKKNTILFKIDLDIYIVSNIENVILCIVQPFILAVDNIANMKSVTVLSGFRQKEFFLMLNKWYLVKIFHYRRKNVFFLGVLGGRNIFNTFLMFWGLFLFPIYYVERKKI